MNKLAVIYWSGTGNTQAMAEAIAEGAEKAGADVSLLTCAEVSDISVCDAVALGCPAMGSEELEDSEFLPMLIGNERDLPFLPVSYKDPPLGWFCLKSKPVFAFSPAL